MTVAESFKQGNQIIADNLKECCQELLDWYDTSILANGFVRQAATCYKDSSCSLSIAESEVKRQALKKVANES